MEIENVENTNQKKEAFKKDMSVLLSELEEQEEILKALQEKFGKQKKEIQKWLSWMG